MNVLNYKSVCERVCIWVHIWASFCLRMDGGLFLSGLIRGSCLFSSLIALPRANIPFVFPLFPLLFIFLLLLDRKKVQHWSLSLVLCLFFYIFSHISRCPMAGCWQTVDRLPCEHTHIPRLYLHQTCCPFWLFFPNIQVFLNGPNDKT